VFDTNNTANLIPCFTAVYHALDIVNEQRAEYFTTLHGGILSALYIQPKGLRCGRLMIAARGKRINSDRFHNALLQLAAERYISKRTKPNSNAVYYHITLKGKALAEELNAHLLALIQKNNPL
jgi:DNA-binding MarR family transcriptional regulator